MQLTEQQKNCLYCRSEDPDANLSIYDNDGEYLAIGSSGDVEVDEGGFVLEESYFLYRGNLFKYCPMCGRPLNEEEE